MLHDIVYFSSILMCIPLAGCYSNIQDSNTKRNYGAGLGVLVACLICGHQFYYTIILVWGNIIIIKCCDKRYTYQLSLAYTWTYLLYLHVNFERSPYFIWLHQTIALRLVGLAFEIMAMDKAKLEMTDPKEAQRLQLFNAPNALDILAYAYFFIGLHKGPYYTWRTFEEHFRFPFGTLGNCRLITRQKLKKALMCVFAFSVLKMKFSTDIYYEADFYASRGADFRYLYNVPQLAMLLLKLQGLMLLSTSVCSEAGFGVYPAKCLSMPGLGPTARFSLLNIALPTSQEEEYNFTMLKCFDNEKLVLGPRMRDSMRGWDMSTWVWFWTYIYKMPGKANKEVRSAFSFLLWTLWWAPTIQHLIASSTLWVHLHLEKEFSELYDTKRQMKTAWDVGFSLMRGFCFIYLTPCFVINDADVIFKYYNSIFWAYHILLILLITTALILHKFFH